MDKNNNNNNNTAKEVANAFFNQNKNKIKSDVLGSYTGTSSIDNEKPEQDADDL